MANKLRSVALLLLAVCLMAVSGCAGGGGDALTVSYIDVGKGDCILVQTAEGAVLIDAGYKKTADSVLEFLESRGVAELEAMIITHYDKDHVGGAAQLAQTLAVGRIYLPGYTPEDNANYETLLAVIDSKALPGRQVTSDVTFTLGGVTFTIFASSVEYDPDDGGEGNDNDVSLVIGAVYGQDSYLFAGDMEKPGIKAYLAAGHDAYDVVKMPHHGRYESNSDKFIAAVDPQIAVITDSQDDPAEDELLALLEAAKIKTYRSSQDGTMIVTSNGKGKYQVKTNA